MIPQISDAGESAFNTASASGARETSEDALPQINFSQPTDAQADQLESLLSDEVTGTQLRALFSDDELPAEVEDLQPLCSCESSSI